MDNTLANFLCVLYITLNNIHVCSLEGNLQCNHHATPGEPCFNRVCTLDHACYQESIIIIINL